MPRSRITGAITSPFHDPSVVLVGGAALQADRAGVDRFLAERAEALALERHVAPAHFAAHEELLQAVVDAAREAHALQDFAALVLRQRRFDRGAAQESVAGIHHFGARLFEPLQRGRARRGFGDAFGRGDVLVQRLRQRAAQRRARRIELDRIAALDRRQPGALERLERVAAARTDGARRRTPQSGCRVRTVSTTSCVRGALTLDYRLSAKLGHGQRAARSLRTRSRVRLQHLNGCEVSSRPDRRRVAERLHSDVDGDRPSVDRAQRCRSSHLCRARRRRHRIEWRVSDEADARELSRWCRAVGAPVFVEPPAFPAQPPSLDELVMVSWNAHLAEGELRDLIAKLEVGRVDRRPAGRAFRAARPGALSPRRRGARVRRARSIRVRDPPARSRRRSTSTITPRRSACRCSTCRRCATAPSCARIAATRSSPPSRCSIRSRSNCRSRASAASRSARRCRCRRIDGPRRLELIDAHLEPLSSPKTLWVFKNPRAGQVRAILDLLETPRSRDRSQSPASCSAATSTPSVRAPVKRRITSRARGRTAWRARTRATRT